MSSGDMSSGDMSSGDMSIGDMNSEGMISGRGDSRPCTGTLPEAHEHGWYVESRHAVSTGHVLYVRCGECGTRRVDVQERADAPPAALSVELGPLD